MGKKVFLILIVSLLMCRAECQDKPSDISRTLEKLFARLVNNFDDNDRIRINDSIRIIIDSYAKSDSVFSHKFSNLKYLGQIKPAGSSLKIITWNLVLRNSPGRYFCYFIKQGENASGNKIYRLTAPYSEKPVVTDTTYLQSQWYGALYYDLRSYKSDTGMYWILLGIDYGNPDISRKIVEVLRITPADSLVFGKRIFSTGTEIKYRDVFGYASNGMMSLRFRSDSSIVFDHLVPFSPANEGDRQYYGPDYSYDAWQLKKTGLWQLEINVDARNEE